MAVIAGSRQLRPPTIAGAVAGAARVLQRNLLVYRRTWRGSLFGSFLTPLLYLTAMGIGLSQLMARGDDRAGGDCKQPPTHHPRILHRAPYRFRRPSLVEMLVGL